MLVFMALPWVNAVPPCPNGSGSLDGGFICSLSQPRAHDSAAHPQQVDNVFPEPRAPCTTTCANVKKLLACCIASQTDASSDPVDLVVAHDAHDLKDSVLVDGSNDPAQLGVTGRSCE